MTEAEYQVLIAKAKQLVKEIQEFPAHELSAFAEAHHPEDKPFVLAVWSLYLEAD